MNLFPLWFYRNRTIFSWIWYQKKHSTNKDKDKFEILIFVRLSLFLSLFGKDNSNFVPPLAFTPLKTPKNDQISAPEKKI